jgi:hypothetical protein
VQKRYLWVGCFRAEDPLPETVIAKLKEFAVEPRKTDGSRTRMVGDHPVVLRYVEPRDGEKTYLLDFARIKDVRAMDLCDLKGNESRVEFKDTEPKPSDRAACILDLPCRCLVIQENNSGISHGSVARYLRQIVDGFPPLRFKMVLEGDAQARMLRSGGFQKFAIGLAKIGNVPDLEAYGFSDDDILRLTSGLNATKATIALSIDRNSEESLNVDGVINLASKLLTLPGKHLKRLRLVPKEIDEDAPAIDLIDDRMRSKHPVTVEELKDLRDEQRYRAVKEAWERHGASLRERYPPQP